MKNDTPAKRKDLYEGSLAIAYKESGIFERGSLVSLEFGPGDKTPLFEDVCKGGRQFKTVGIMIPLKMSKEDLLGGAWIPNIGIKPACDRVDVHYRDGGVCYGAKSESPYVKYWDISGNMGDILKWRPSGLAEDVPQQRTENSSGTVRAVMEVPGDLSMQTLKQEMRGIGARIVSFYDD